MGYRVVGEIQPENQKMKFQTDHFSSILDCPKEGQRKFQPLRRKTGKRTEVFGRERLRKYSLSIGYYYDSIWTGKPKPGGLPSDLFGGANPPDERKEGDANECYILGFDPVADFHCCPDRSVLSDLQGKEIAATTLNSDGLNN